MSDTTKIHSRYKQAITALKTETGNMPQIIEALKAREDWWRADSEKGLDAFEAALAEAERLRAALAEELTYWENERQVHEQLKATSSSQGWMKHIVKHHDRISDALDGEKDGA